MTKSERYYRVTGKNRHIPKTYYTKTTNVATAKQHFYIDAGDDISSVIQITKETYIQAI